MGFGTLDSPGGEGDSLTKNLYPLWLCISGSHMSLAAGVLSWWEVLPHVDSRYAFLNPGMTGARPQTLVFFSLSRPRAGCVPNLPHLSGKDAGTFPDQSLVFQWASAGLAQNLDGPFGRGLSGYCKSLATARTAS